jgi:hypothetical protein
MTWPASPLNATVNLEHAQLFLTETNVHINSAKKVAQQKMLAQNPLAHMMQPPKKSNATFQERIVMTKTNAPTILAMLSKDVSTPSTKLSRDVILQFANLKLIVLNGLPTTTLLLTAKMLSVTTLPRLAELFWSTTKIAIHAWVNARKTALLLILARRLNVSLILPPKNVVVSEKHAFVTTKTHVPLMFATKLRDVSSPILNLLPANNSVNLIATVPTTELLKKHLWNANSLFVTKQPLLANLFLTQTKLAYQ